ncbi:MAG: hypothetical protein Q8R39_00750 [bacterium]|nr:hypothetical protein [bacterium]MDZ4285274.1 hypothetical protein [Patescibacteria group bacterium]
MEQAALKNFLVLTGIGVGALVIGTVGGYLLGVGQGRQVLLAEQAAEREKAAAEAEAALVEAANPFAAENQAAANPFEGAYQNPFEAGTVNPFAQ